MVVTALLLLSCLGLLTVQAQDCSRPVGGPNMDLKDKDILSQTFPDGSQVSFKCNVGYRPAGGSAVVTCTAGNWNPVRLTCEIFSCGPLKDVPNGIIDYPNDAVFGQKAVITCSPGHILIGSNEITCGDQGWMDREPVCQAVHCDPPAGITNGKYSPNKETYAYKEVIQYSCQSDYTLNGSKSVHCSEDGTFKPGVPICTKVQCKDPEIEHGDYKEGSRPPYGYLSSVTLQCRSGHIMKGTPIVTCDINSQWSPALPECKPVECKEPTIKNGKRKVDSKPPFRYSSTVTLECDSGYKMAGEPIQRCGENGLWSPGLPACNSGSNIARDLGIAAGVVTAAVLLVQHYWL